VGKYILVIGCSTIDESFYERGIRSKISPGGKGNNQAIALAKAGSKVVFLTKLSGMKEDKLLTNLILKNIKKNKINKKFIEFDKNHHNDYTRIEVSSDGDNKLIESSDISKTFNKTFVSKHKELIKNASFVIIQLKVPDVVTKEIFRLCKMFNVKTVLTPCRPQKARKNWRFIEEATHITCNKKEFYEVFAESNQNKYDEDFLNKTLKKYPNKLIVTLGEKGVKWFDGKRVCFEKAIKAERVIDTTGAGDTFCGNMVSCLNEGESLRNAIRKGICASTLKIQVAGTQEGMPKKKERDALYSKVYSKES